MNCYLLKLVDGYLRIHYAILLFLLIFEIFLKGKADINKYGLMFGGKYFSGIVINRFSSMKWLNRHILAYNTNKSRYVIKPFQLLNNKL